VPSFYGFITGILGVFSEEETFSVHFTSGKRPMRSPLHATGPWDSSPSFVTLPFFEVDVLSFFLHGHGTPVDQVREGLLRECHPQTSGRRVLAACPAGWQQSSFNVFLCRLVREDLLRLPGLFSIVDVFRAFRAIGSDSRSYVFFRFLYRWAAPSPLATTKYS